MDDKIVFWTAWAALATTASAFVIAITALVAIVQIRKIRDSNQIAGLTECRKTIDSEAFREARRFVAYDLQEKLKDPNVQETLRHPVPIGELQQLVMVGNFFENLGAFVKFGIIERTIALDLWSGIVVEAWDQVGPALNIMRGSRRDVWENFELLAVLSKDWVKRHPEGSYPARMRRLDLADAASST